MSSNNSNDCGTSGRVRGYSAGGYSLLRREEPLVLCGALELPTHARNQGAFNAERGSGGVEIRPFEASQFTSPATRKGCECGRSTKLAIGDH